MPEKAHAHQGWPPMVTMHVQQIYANTNKKAVLSQRRPRDAPYI